MAAALMACESKVSPVGTVFCLTFLLTITFLDLPTILLLFFAIPFKIYAGSFYCTFPPVFNNIKTGKPYLF
jgi:hypothetical protein